ncbi:MAG: adenylate/guanylate cyclase domain-containing protein, partial [Chloroflexota bacterium]
MTAEPIKTLTTYVPALVVRRIASDPNPISAPTAERFGAAVLFADIRDFTALADKLARQGQVGAELLADLLNDCFGQLIDVVHEHGGEVTKFAGDALLALWPVSQDVSRLGSEARLALSRMVIRSAQCGLAIQETLNVFEAEDGTRLRLQVGIGAGDVYSVHLGGVFNRWEFLLSGTPLAQMSQAKENARPGKVVLSPEAWSLISSECAGTTLPGGFVELRATPQALPISSLKLPTLSIEAKSSLQSYVPAAVLSRLEAGHEGWLSEMRKVVVLFIKLPQYGTSIKHPYERTIPEAQAVMEALQGALYRYAGSINKLNVDDKGITLVAALGLPPLSHRNDAARAVQAALEMQLALGKLGRRSAIGITMGWVLCGPIGSPERREYTMVGNAVNMAARLMQVAAESLAADTELADTLCDEAVFEAIRRLAEEGDSLAQQLTFRSLPSVIVKGLPEPVSAYRPSFQRSPRYHMQHQKRRSSPLLGKDAGRAIVESRMRLLRRMPEDSRGGLIIVESEAGSGKTLMLDELRALAVEMRLRVLEGAGDGLEQVTPYYAWRSVFQAIFDLDPFIQDRHARRSHILRQLPPIRGERGFPAFAIRMSPLLNAVLPLDLPESQTTSRMAPAQRHRTTQQFLLRLLQRRVVRPGRRRARPSVLLFDNGQWMDRYSWELAIGVSQEVKPLLTIIATRPLSEQAAGRPLAQISRQLEGEEHVSRLGMSLLTKEQLADLLWHELGIQA